MDRDKRYGQAPGVESGPASNGNQLDQARIRIAQQRRLIARKAAKEGADEGEQDAEVSQPGDAAEQEADTVADAVADEMHAEGEGDAAAGEGGEAEGEQAAPEELEEAKLLVGDDKEGGDGGEVPPEVEALAPPIDGPEAAGSDAGEPQGEAGEQEAGEAEGEAEDGAEGAGAAAAPKEKAPQIGAKLEPGTISLSKPQPGKTVSSPPGKTGFRNQGLGPRASNLSGKTRDQQDQQKDAARNAPMPPDQKRPATALSDKQQRDLEGRIKAGDRNVTKGEIEALNRTKRVDSRRADGVTDFWARERQKLEKGEKPTRAWSEEQKKAILAGERPKGPTDGKTMEGHHKYGVKDFPQVAATGANIHPATKKEHRERWHGGDTRADTDGKPRNPKQPEEF
jgi:hypothetical protein